MSLFGWGKYLATMEHKGLHKVTRRDLLQELIMAVQKVNILRFLELLETTPVADVRSPSEFNFGHIPGAINIPLFDDEEREAVGTKYKNEGRLPAIMEGLKHSGPALDIQA